MVAAIRTGAKPFGDISTGSTGYLLQPCSISLQVCQILTQRTEIQNTESEGVVDEGLTTGIIDAIKFRIVAKLVESFTTAHVFICLKMELLRNRWQRCCVHLRQRRGRIGRASFRSVLGITGSIHLAMTAKVRAL